MTRWYRAYENTVTDPKLGEAAALAECSRSIAIAGWHAVLESACQSNDAGRFTTTARRVAIILGEPPELIARLLDAFSELGMISSGAVTAWSRRQFQSDSSTERVRRHRSKGKGNGDETLHRRRVTAPDTEADTETESSGADAPGAAAPPGPPAPAPPSAADLKAAVFASGVPLLTSTGTSDRNARTMIGRWRSDHGDGAVLDALAAAQGKSEPVAFVNRWLGGRDATGRGGGRRGQRQGYRDEWLERELAFGGGDPGMG